MHGNLKFLVTVMILDYSKALNLQGIREFLEQNVLGLNPSSDRERKILQHTLMYIHNFLEILSIT